MALMLAASATSQPAPQQSQPSAPVNDPRYGRTEDGRLIVWADQPLWCFTDVSGGGGMCGHTASECADYSNIARSKGINAGECQQMWAAACAYQTHVVTGRATEHCFTSVSDCDVLAYDAVRKGEMTGPTRCAVYRMRGQ